MMEHSREPWEGDNRGHGVITDVFGNTVATANKQNDASRIVACVNACDGISTEVLEKFGFGNALKIPKNVRNLERQKNELLAALEALQDIGCLEPGLIGSGGGIEEAQEKARTAIDHAKGSKK